MNATELRQVLDEHGKWWRGGGGKRADLWGANLRGANLRGANLRDARLQGADLRDARLQGASLQGADLWGANLRGANLRGANLRGANLRGANLPPSLRAHLSILPAGELIGWKKCQGGIIVELTIPADARRSNATSRKCRAEWAIVRAVHGAEVGVSIHDGRTTYRAGETVRPDEWCDDWREECAGGIHFFITREEAEEYV